jgi:uncharacterized protein (DUF2249 family)
MTKRAMAPDGEQVESPAGAARTAATLPVEHALLFHEVSLRCDAVTGAADEDHWPAPELHQLLDYLHVEVLQQVVNEEWLLFRAWHHAPEGLLRLRADHLELRRAIDALTDAATGARRLNPHELTNVIAGLLKTLQDHFSNEEALLLPDADTVTPSTSSLGSTPHEWYAHTEGPVIDLANLPGSRGVDAVLSRLLRLGQGERIELHATTDPSPLWRRLAATHPDGYGFAYLQRGPEQWSVEIIRRPAP